MKTESYFVCAGFGVLFLMIVALFVRCDGFNKRIEVLEGQIDRQIEINKLVTAFIELRR